MTSNTQKVIHVAHNVMHPVYYGSVAVWGHAPYSYCAGFLCCITLWMVFSTLFHTGEEDGDVS